MNLMRSPARAMAAPIGLYGHVRSNHLRSLVLFAGFLVAFHLMAGAVLTLPLLLFDPGHAPVIGAGGYSRRYLLPLTAIGAVIFLVRYWWHVSAVHRDTGFRYIDGCDEPRLVRLLEPLILAAGLKPPFVGVIESDAMNAFAVGVRDSHMVVVVTRGLLDGLDDEELEGVLAHELMHIRNRDTRLMAAANAFLGNLVALRGQLIDDDKLENGRTVIGFMLLPAVLPLMLALWFLGNLAHRIGYVSRAAISSSREFIADAEAVRLTHNPAALASALRKVHGRDRISGLAESHDAMLIAGTVEGPAATHPSIAQRIAALVQTTGPAMAYAPLRRDTRSPEQRQSAGFGRALGEDLMAEVEAAERPGLWGLFRLTRDPERNMFGLRRRGAMIVWASAGGALALWGGLFVATGRSADPASLLTMTEGVRVAVRCQVSAYGGLLGVSDPAKGCSQDEIDALASRYAKQVGTSYRSPVAAEQHEKQAWERTYRANRCFPYSIHSWDSPRRSLIGDESKWSLDFMQRYADQPIAGFETPLEPGKTSADALISYMSLRLIMTDNASYYLGAEAHPAVVQMFETPRHQDMIAKFQAALKAPGFQSYFEQKASNRDSLRLLAEYPGAVPCDMRIAQGTYRKDPALWQRIESMK
ncbi:M48 family metalloprotease [Sphingomonas sp. BN140010]|uniref:M48 family metalloprotease n=1 Tax=Sphingomonas arvum TaxID=2992113 RepID=A0ABT3JG49_9SPHN|nr:M48 family metalloprotease [Sphingomonas sp. BN140010]MCW3798062.1 M48 family metalloprotease [Sphingomonas sp. BN140010]